jgi:hypothetical protein
VTPSLLLSKQIRLLLCFDNKAFQEDHFFETDVQDTDQVFYAQKVERTVLEQTSIDVSWCKKNYQCFVAFLPVSSLQVGTLLAYSDLENKAFSPTVLTQFSFQKINTQKYLIDYEHFLHPVKRIDFNIKVKAQKWSVVDNKYGSALMRLDLLS